MARPHMKLPLLSTSQINAIKQTFLEHAKQTNACADKYIHVAPQGVERTLGFSREAEN